LATLLKLGEVLVKHRRPRPRHPEVASEATDHEHRKENQNITSSKKRRVSGLAATGETALTQEGRFDPIAHLKLLEKRAHVILDGPLTQWLQSRFEKFTRFWRGVQWRWSAQLPPGSTS
jgi:hypothetical protein